MCITVYPATTSCPVGDLSSATSTGPLSSSDIVAGKLAIDDPKPVSSRDDYGSVIKNVLIMPSKHIKNDKLLTSGTQPHAQKSLLKWLQKIKNTKAVYQQTRCVIILIKRAMTTSALGDGLDVRMIVVF